MTEIKQIQVKIPEDLEPNYVNLAYISHTPAEFVMDFVTMLPGVANPKVNTRLVLAPLAMKLLQAALNENVKRYEEKFGTIAVPQGSSLADKLFRHPNIPPEGEE